MEYRQFGDKYLIRIQKSEELVGRLKWLCSERNIVLGTVNGLGALRSVTLGFFSPDTKVYHEETLQGPFEMVSLTGNVTTKAGEPYLHLHILVSGSDFRALGGHLVSAVVSATAEICVDAFPGHLERTFSDEIGLNLFDYTK